MYFIFDGIKINKDLFLMIKMNWIICFLIFSISFPQDQITGEVDEISVENSFRNNFDELEPTYVLEKPINPKEYKIGPGDGRAPSGGPVQF